MTCGCEMSSIVSLIDVFAFVSHVCGGDMIDDRAGLIPSVCGGVDEQFSSFFVVFAPAEALFCVQAEPARSVEDRVPAEQRRGRVGPEAGAALALQLAHPRAVLAHARAVLGLLGALLLYLDAAAPGQRVGAVHRRYKYRIGGGRRKEEGSKYVESHSCVQVSKKFFELKNT